MTVRVASAALALAPCVVAPGPRVAVPARSRSQPRSWRAPGPRQATRRMAQPKTGMLHGPILARPAETPPRTTWRFVRPSDRPSTAHQMRPSPDHHASGPREIMSGCTPRRIAGRHPDRRPPTPAPCPRHIESRTHADDDRFPPTRRQQQGTGSAARAAQTRSSASPPIPADRATAWSPMRSQAVRRVADESDRPQGRGLPRAAAVVGRNDVAAPRLEEQCGGGGRDDCSIADGAVRRCRRRAAAVRSNQQ